jgi:hypothetical protein
VRELPARQAEEILVARADGEPRCALPGSDERCAAKTQPIVVQRTDLVGGNGDDREVVQNLEAFGSQDGSSGAARRRSCSGSWPMAIFSVDPCRGGEPARSGPIELYFDDAALESAAHAPASHVPGASTVAWQGGRRIAGLGERAAGVGS